MGSLIFIGDELTHATNSTFSANNGIARQGWRKVCRPER
jgi:hypothetical protein